VNEGEIVKIKDAAGNKVKARVVAVQAHTDVIMVEGGRIVPGRTTTRLMLELISEVKPPKERKLKLGDKGLCSHQFVGEICDAPATAQYDPYMRELYDVEEVVMLCEHHLQERWDEI
jgi:hypothetical protein